MYLQFSAHRIKMGTLGVWIGINGRSRTVVHRHRAGIDLSSHLHQKANRLHLWSFLFLFKCSGNVLTGFANHLPPPVSNQLRCPPVVVVHNTANGFCLNSSYGSASLTAIYRHQYPLIAVGVKGFLQDHHLHGWRKAVFVQQAKNPRTMRHGSRRLLWGSPK